MKTILSIAFILFSSLHLEASEQKKSLKYMNIEQAVNSKQAASILDSDIKFYFPKQEHPEVSKTIIIAKSQRAINVTFKFGAQACIAAFLETLKALQDTAKEQEADAIINISSYYNEEQLSSETSYLCEPGFFVSSVSLKAEVVKIKKQP